MGEVYRRAVVEDRPDVAEVGDTERTSVAPVALARDRRQARLPLRHRLLQRVDMGSGGQLADELESQEGGVFFILETLAILATETWPPRIAL